MDGRVWHSKRGIFEEVGSGGNDVIEAEGDEG